MSAGAIEVKILIGLDHIEPNQSTRFELARVLNNAANHFFESEPESWTHIQSIAGDVIGEMKYEFIPD